MSEGAFGRAVEYVEMNPVVAGLASEPREYGWSTAGGAFETDMERYLGPG